MVQTLQDGGKAELGLPAEFEKVPLPQDLLDLLMVWSS